MFNENLLKSVLSENQKTEGLYLVEDENFLYLMRHGENLPLKIFPVSEALTFAEIRKEADQVAGELSLVKSGVIFEKVGG